MTGVENLMYTAALNGIARDEAHSRAVRLMERVGLGEQMEKKAGKYSRGMRQRLGLADVLIKQPQIVILDEPTSGIDPAGVQEFIALIKQLSSEGQLTVLFSSHNLEQVQKVCDRVGLFNRGRLVAQIGLEELRRENRDLADVYNRYFTEGGGQHDDQKVHSPFWTIVRKEIARPCAQPAVHYSGEHHRAHLRGVVVYGAYEYRGRDKSPTIRTAPSSS